MLVGLWLERPGLISSLVSGDVGCRCQGKEGFMFPFPREYDRCLSIRNNHFTNVRQISYPTQLIARGMLPSRGCSSDERSTVMTIYCCCREPALGADPLRGLSERGGEKPTGVLTRSCAPLAQRAGLTVRGRALIAPPLVPPARPLLARQM